MKPLRLVVFGRRSHASPEQESLSIEIRISQPLQYIANRDLARIEYALVDEADPRAEQALRWADVVLFNKARSHLSLKWMTQAREAGKRAIYDLDDYIFEYPTYNPNHSLLNAAAKLSAAVMSLASVITVSNEKLRQIVAERFPGTRCELVPTGMDCERYGPAGGPASERLLLANADTFKLVNGRSVFIDAVNDFLARYPSVTLDYIGDFARDLLRFKRVRHIRRMRFDTFMSFIAHQHYRFALVPLGTGEDDELQLFNECKSPVKTLNFGAVRLPAIYSRSKVYTGIVQHRGTGLLVNNSYAEWVDGMRLMYHDGRVREEIGANSREEVRKRHHISAMASRLLGVIQPA